MAIDRCRRAITGYNGYADVIHDLFCRATAGCWTNTKRIECCWAPRNLAGRRRRDSQFISWCKRVEAALRVQAFSTEMHRMQGVLAQIDKSKRWMRRS